MNLHCSPRFVPFQLIFSFAIVLIMVSCTGSSKDKSGENKTEEEIPLSALQKLNQQIQSAPTASLYNQRALVFLGQNELEPALEDVRTALTLDSLNGEYWYTGALIFKKNIQIPLSLEYAKKAEKSGYNSEDLFLLMSLEYLTLMQYQEAISSANKALKQNEASHTAYYYKGMVYEETGDLIRAISSYQTALEQNSTFPDAYNSLIKIYTAKGDYKMASEYVKSGQRFLPDDVFIWYNYGILVEKQGLLDSAVVIYLKTEELDSTFDLVKYKLAGIYAGQENLEKAVTYYEKVLQINPTFEQAYLEQGELLLSRAKTEEAREVLRRGLMQFPDSKKMQQLYEKSKR